MIDRLYDQNELRIRNTSTVHINKTYFSTDKLIIVAFTLREGYGKEVS